VAVKVLEKSRIKDKKDVERISREIKILKTASSSECGIDLRNNRNRK